MLKKSGYTLEWNHDKFLLTFENKWQNQNLNIAASGIIARYLF